MNEELQTEESAKTTDLQRQEQDGRDERGRFAKGNTHGWRRGQTGNAKGRRDALTDALRRKLDEPYGGGRSKRDAVVDALIEEAAAGSVRAAELIWTRLEGRLGTSSTVDINLSHSEFHRYEAKVTQLCELAERRGLPISRSKAIKLLSASDPRILDIISEGEDDE